MIREFADITAEAARRKGGSAELEVALIATRVSPPLTVAAIPDDRILAEMSRWIFYAGFSVRVVDGKWPSFERTFSRFDLLITASMDDGRIDALSQNPNIIRNRRKIRAVRTNAGADR